jgi:hypothetical protein
MNEIVFEDHVIPLRDSRYSVRPKQNKSGHELAVRIIGQDPGFQLWRIETELNPQCEALQVPENTARLEECDLGKALFRIFPPAANGQRARIRADVWGLISGLE